MMTLIHLGLAALLTAPPAPMQTPDIFSCVEPGRLATGTFAYQLDENPNRPHLRRTVSAVDAGGRRLIRVTWTTPTPSEHATDLDAATLTLVRSRITTTFATGTTASGELEVIDGEIRGSVAPSSPPLAVPTEGRQVIFGSYMLEVIAAAVNWDRCPSVIAHVLSSRQVESALLTRTRTPTFALHGAAVPAIEITVWRSDRKGRIWIAQAAPRAVLRFSTVLADGTFSLVSRQE